MYYLGQSVANQEFVNGKKQPAIITGFNEWDIPIITYINQAGELVKHKQGYVNDIKPLKVYNKKSPTGVAVYYGKFCKKGVILDAKMKLPSDEALVAELKEIQKILDTV